MVIAPYNFTYQNRSWAVFCQALFEWIENNFEIFSRYQDDDTRARKMGTLRKMNRSGILLNLNKRILKAKLIMVLSEHEGSSYHTVT